MPAPANETHQFLLDTLIRGNHDNGFIPSNLGKIQFKDTHTIGNRILIAHGDKFDKIMPRCKLFIWVFKIMHDIRIKLGAKPVHVAY